MKSQAQQYLKTMVETCAPVENIIALYEKCLLHLATVRTGIAGGDVSVWSEALHRAMDILCYLEASLDAGHREAEPLQRSYRMILARLGLVSANGSLEDVALAEHWLEGMLAAWREAGHHSHGGRAAGEEGERLEQEGGE